MAPLSHDVAGTPISFITKLMFIWTIVKGLPGLISNRVRGNWIQIWEPTAAAIQAHHRGQSDHYRKFFTLLPASTQFVVFLFQYVKRIREEKKYEKVGVIGCVSLVWTYSHILIVLAA